jgi:hypothetical protein
LPAGITLGARHAGLNMYFRFSSAFCEGLHAHEHLNFADDAKFCLGHPPLYRIYEHGRAYGMALEGTRFTCLDSRFSGFLSASAANKPLHVGRSNI